MAKRRKNQRKNKKTTITTVAVRSPVMIQQPPRARSNKRSNNRGGARCTEDGVAFLKSAFAAPDVGITPFKGIPDNNNSNVVIMCKEGQFDINPTAGKVTYILIPPVPGVAYFYDGSVDSGSDPNVFETINYPGALSLFPENDESRNFTEFRLGGMAAELKNMANSQQWGGSISTYKIPMTLSLRTTNFGLSNAAAEATQFYLDGLRGVSSVAPKDAWMGSIQEGCYTVAYDRTGDFKFNPIVASVNSLHDGHKPREGAWPDTAVRINTGNSTNVPGWGNLDTIVFKISAPEGSQNALKLHTWVYYEFKPSPYGTFMDMSSLSPGYDPKAMVLYNSIKARLPVAVPARENSNFWERVLRIVKYVTNGLSFFPGPVGLVSQGVKMAVDAVF